ncbi:hypothetical protein B7767_06810 [Streptomyces sp. 13-12-16]|nr:hypothetical protein B7767_06810 [Streptomyces sp. 13-12-16]
MERHPRQGGRDPDHRGPQAHQGREEARRYPGGLTARHTTRRRGPGRGSGGRHAHAAGQHGARTARGPGTVASAFTERKRPPACARRRLPCRAAP